MVKSFKEIPKSKEKDFAVDKLSELRNETFEISAVRFGEAEIGEYAIVTVNNTEYRTFSKVLLKQLRDIQKYLLSAKDTVEVTLKRVGDYHTFE